MIRLLKISLFVLLMLFLKACGQTLSESPNNLKPEILLLSFKNDQQPKVTYRQSYEISWRAVDENLTENPISIFITYNNKDWQALVKRIPNSGSVTLTLASAPIETQHARIKIIAKDQDGAYAEDYSKLFSISSPELTK